MRFSNLQGTFGSGLYYKDEKFSNLTNLTLRNSFFQNLTGWCGAAVYISNVENVEITNTLFKNNSVPFNQSHLI